MDGERVMIANGIPCPSCGHENIRGEDRCVQCFHSLMQRDIPRPKKDDKLQSVMMTAPVSELLTGKDLLVASPKDSLAKIIQILQDRRLKCILVYERKKLVGILSTRDVLRKVAGKENDKKLSEIKVASVMTPKPEFVSAQDPIAFAVNKMALGGFRHVPVLAPDGTPLSIISIKDVMTYLSRRDKG